MKPGARECLKLLHRYQSYYGEGNVSIRQSRIASELRKPLRSVQRWIGQLARMDLIEVTQSGPGAAEYIVKKNGGALAELWRSKAAVSINELKTNKPMNRSRFASKQHLGRCLTAEEVYGGRPMSR